MSWNALNQRRPEGFKKGNIIFIVVFFISSSRKKKKKSRQEKKEVSEFTLFNERKVNILSIICIFEIKYVSLTT